MARNTASETVVIGTRQHYGVAGCMFEELSCRGDSVRFLELMPNWSRGIAARAAARVMGRAAPRTVLARLRVQKLASHESLRYAIVTNGRELGAATVSHLRQALEQRGGGVACFLCDDPFNPVHRSEAWLSALVEYSLVVSTKRAAMPDLIKAGCRRVAYARFGYHPPIHCPVDPAAEGFAQIDVAFAGNADRDRLPIMGALVEGATDLMFGLYGHGWAANPALKDLVRPQVTGLQYSAAMRAATVCPCLVRRANRDGHVMRSIELPAMGAFMLAERTDEHQEIFEEGIHCDYWSTVEELIERSRWYARNPGRAAKIAMAGHRLITSNPHTYADRALEILEMLGRPASAR